MAINENFKKFEGQAYLFPEIGRRMNAFLEANPGAKEHMIKLGIGDATEPLDARTAGYMSLAAERMTQRNGFSKDEIEGNPVRQDLHEAGYDKFSGYGDEQGNTLLKKRINDTKYGGRFNLSEIFVTEGAKADCSNMQKLVSLDTVVALQNPAYPVYEGSNVIAGRTGGVIAGTSSFEGLVYLACNEENGFMPALPNQKVGLIYLCSPNNPTGVAFTKEQLQPWIDYAIDEGALVIFDNAYERFITNPDAVHTVYDVPGAEKCAIEISSFSKEAGFTGVRLGSNVVPKSIVIEGAKEGFVNWCANKKACTEFNGPSITSQAAGLAIMTPLGQEITQKTIEHYMGNAKIEREAFESRGYKVYGGVDAPYNWIKLKDGEKSWDGFNRFMNDLNIVVTPGVGFGSEGEGFIRLSGFGSRASVEKAAERIRDRG